ncbi:MAG: hypothetical protein V1704_01815 [Candidatus Vogelbacteria bacterium]
MAQFRCGLTTKKCEEIATRKLLRGGFDENGVPLSDGQARAQQLFDVAIFPPRDGQKIRRVFLAVPRPAL